MKLFTRRTFKMPDNPIIKTLASKKELNSRNEIVNDFKNSPIPDHEILANIGLYQKRQDLTKTLFFNDLYQKILPVHGVIMEFGVRWGQNLTTLINLRGIHEPFNHSRRIIGFDTFSGFEKLDEKDGNHEVIQKGAFGVTEGYENHLDKVLSYHESESPLSHIKKFELVKGDASKKLKEYLSSNQQTIVAMAWFDFDVYEPTRKCLDLILPYMAKGGIIGFDELCDPNFPGETVAYREVFGNEKEIKRSPYSGIQSYIQF